MQNREGKIILRSAMALAVFTMLNTVQLSTYESKEVLQQIELRHEQRSIMADAESYQGVKLMEINESIAEAADTTKEEASLQEAVIDSAKIDHSLLDKLKYEVAKEKEIVADFIRAEKIIMDKGEDYSAVKGITCFRGNNYRDSASFGYATIKEKKLEVKWQIAIGGIDNWTGVGWNGQPSIIEWSKELRSSMNIREEKKQKDNLREIIYAALDGKVYFLDLEDRSPTRGKIDIPGPVKGSLTVDPRGMPLLYVGQGINTVAGKHVEMGYRISGNSYQGIENSVAVYRNLAYFADNGGWLQCVDINTLKPVWTKAVTDDTDSTIVIEEEDEAVSLYTACEVDKQGTKGMSHIRKIDALSGRLI